MKRPVSMMPAKLWGGAYTAGNNNYRAFLYSNGVMTDLGTLGGSHSSAFGVNDAGQVVGWADTAGNDWHAFLYSSGVMTDLGTLGGGPYSLARDVNEAGQVVGYSYDALMHTLPFLYSGGVMTDLNTLVPADSGWRLDAAYGINDSGQITGYGHHNGRTEAFLLTPDVMAVPEPGTWALTGTAVIALLSWRRRWKTPR